VETLQRASATALSAAREALESDRYLRLLARLNDLVVSPPWRPKATKPIAKSYLPRVEHDWKRLSERVAAARQVDDPAARAAALHEGRKAAKRLRYAMEPLVPVIGKPAKRSVRDAKDLQSLLGEHHDAVVARGAAKQLANAAPTEEESSALVAVQELEDRRLAAGEAELDGVWKRIKAKKRRRWYR
jgi:CHAD domain-containing protein